MRLDAYIRVSDTRGREGPSFISPTDQLEKIEDYARRHGHEIVEVHRELDQSGTRDDRPLFQRALERVERKDTDGIIVAKLDRFARSVLGAKTAIERIQKAGGDLIAVDNKFDTTASFGKFGMTMMLAIAELEADRIRENWATARRMAVMDRGIHIASRPPTGYRQPKDAAGKSQPLELAKKDAKAVQRMFRSRANGASLRDLAEILQQSGVRGPYTNNVWTAAAVAKLLRNPVYFGQARSGEFVKDEAHPPIVNRAEWDAAQSPRLTPTPHRGDGALLSGILRCSGCRYLMKPDTMTDRKGERIRLYRCRGEHAAGDCTKRSSVLGRVIEPYVEEEFFSALGPGGILAQPISETFDLEDADARLLDAEREHHYCRDQIDPEVVGATDYMAGLQARQKKITDISREIANATTSLFGEDMPDVITLRGVWDEFSIKERRQLLAAGIDAVMLRGGRKRDLSERAHIFFHSEAPDDLPRRGRRHSGIRSFAWPDDDGLDAFSSA